MPVFDKCYAHFVESLARYLRRQEKRINFEYSYDNICDRMENALFKLNLREAELNFSVLNSLSYEKIDYQFIVFNYTKVFENFIEAFRKKVRRKLNSFTYKFFGDERFEHLLLGETIYIHGNLSENMIFVVNDSSQIADYREAKSHKIDRFLLKPYSNSLIHNRDYEDAKKVIRDSNIICIYGMSLGETDKLWWDMISKWLATDERKHLVIFTYCNECEAINERIKEHKNRLNSVSVTKYFDRVDIEDELKERQKEVSENLKKKFLGYSNLVDGAKEAIKERIHIIINANLFGGKII